MKQGRPIKFSSDEDRLKSIKDSKTKYMLNKSWKCDICQYEANLASKHMHLKTKKHITNTILQTINEDERFQLINDNEEMQSQII